MWLWFAAAHAECDPHPADAEAWRSAARCLEAAGAEPAAALAWRRAYALAPADDPWAALARGDAAVAAGDGAGAVAAYESVPPGSAAYGPAQFRLGVQHLRAGEARGAVLAFRAISGGEPEPRSTLAAAGRLGIGVAYLEVARRGGMGKPPAEVYGMAATYLGMLGSEGPLVDLARVITAEAKLRSGDRKGAIQSLQQTKGDVPEALPLNVALARDPARTFAAESARWRQIRARLLAGEVELDLPAVWGLRPAPGEPLAQDLLNEARQRAIQVRVARIDAALAAAEANVAGGERSSFDFTQLDFGG